MESTLYIATPIIAVFVAFLSTRKKKTKTLVPNTLPHSSSYQWSIYIKNNEQIYKEYEENDLSKVGYHIYSKLEKPNVIEEFYIRENLKNELMWINKDYESEWKICVANPEGSPIGYLPFSKVNSI